jgi:hypothetical protein
LVQRLRKLASIRPFASLPEQSTLLAVARLPLPGTALIADHLRDHAGLQ